MKAFAALIFAAVSLSGCAIVPYEPAIGVYPAPPPAVVVHPHWHHGHHPRYRGHSSRGRH